MTGRIKYSKEFQIMSHEWIGFEIDVNEWDNPDDKFAEIKNFVNKWGNGDDSLFQINPSLYRSSIPATGTMPHVQPFPVRNLAAERLVILIDNAETKDELAGLWDKVVEYGVKDLYENKLKQLQ